MFEEEFLKQEVKLTLQDVLIGFQLLEKALGHQPINSNELEVLDQWFKNLRAAWKGTTGEEYAETVMKLAKEAAEKDKEKREELASKMAE